MLLFHSYSCLYLLHWIPTPIVFGVSCQSNFSNNIAVWRAVMSYSGFDCHAVENGWDAFWHLPPADRIEGHLVIWKHTIAVQRNHIYIHKVAFLWCNRGIAACIGRWTIIWFTSQGGPPAVGTKLGTTYCTFGIVLDAVLRFKKKRSIRFSLKIPASCHSEWAQFEFFGATQLSIKHASASPFTGPLFQWRNVPPLDWNADHSAVFACFCGFRMLMLHWQPSDLTYIKRNLSSTFAYTIGLRFLKTGVMHTFLRFTAAR